MRATRKDGRPTAYGFACGGVERFGNDVPRVSIEREHGTYHVKGFNADGTHFWQSFRTLTEARKEFDTLRRAFLKFKLRAALAGGRGEK